MKKDTRISLAEILVDLAAIRAAKGHRQDAGKLLDLASDVASGRETVFDQLQK